MSVQIRLPRKLYDQVRADLSRPHPHAAERVGFLFGKLGNANTASPIILLTRYSPLGDERYINDPFSGARIDSQAIRSAMQRVIDRGECVFHVHAHEWPGTPHFSPMDRRELPRLIPSFQVVGPGLAHGLFLLSDDECVAEVWLRGHQVPVTAGKIAVVGHPVRIFYGS